MDAHRGQALHGIEAQSREEPHTPMRADAYICMKAWKRIDSHCLERSRNLHSDLRCGVAGLWPRIAPLESCKYACLPFDETCVHAV
eukprot:6212192-Pleurochrysis_carterae.AAC.3